QVRAAVPARPVAVDPGPRRTRPARPGRLGTQAVGRQPRPVDAEHHRIAPQWTDDVRVRPPRPALPPVRHPHRQGRTGRPGHLLVPDLPTGGRSASSDAFRILGVAPNSTTVSSCPDRSTARWLALAGGSAPTAGDLGP